MTDTVVMGHKSMVTTQIYVCYFIAVAHIVSHHRQLDTLPTTREMKMLSIMFCSGCNVIDITSHRTFVLNYLTLALKSYGHSCPKFPYRADAVMAMCVPCPSVR
jgi:site-specific recombinase XerD